MFKVLKGYILLSMLYIAGFNMPAQNLVPNPSFEMNTSCPTGGEFYKITPWCGLGGGEDSFDTCNNVLGPGANGIPYAGFGFQYPRTGKAFGMVATIVIGGLVPNLREYLHVPLNKTLVGGKMYCGKMYLNLYNPSKYTTDAIGMYLSSIPYQCNQAMPIPQMIPSLNVTAQIMNTTGLMITDTLNWMEVSGTFTATGNEQYLTIGNFTTDALTNTMVTNPSSGYTVTYFLIDDVSLEEIQPASLAKDSVSICLGESTMLQETDSFNVVQYSWLPTHGLSCTNCRTPIAKSNSFQRRIQLPRRNVKTVTQDVVYVEVKTDCHPSSMPQLEIPNVFTPNGDERNDTFYFKLDPEFSNISFTVYDRWGLIVNDSQNSTYHQITWDGRTTSGEECSAGVYFYVLQFSNAKGETQKKTGYLTLFR